MHGSACGPLTIRYLTLSAPVVLALARSKDGAAALNSAPPG
jgi:hypothetical protein